MKSFNKEVCYTSLKQAASHYANEQGYCSVIAVAIATGCKFGKAKSIMRTKGLRREGCGASTYGIHNALESCGKVVIPYATRKGFTVKNAAKNLPKTGTFLIYSSMHVTCMKDGIVQDWVMLEGARNKRMKCVYEVTAS